MRSDVIRVKKPATVRIVNPDSFEILGRTYRHNDRLRVRRGGRFVVLSVALDGRALAAYEAPHPPTADDDCPTGALLFQPICDLELAAEGILHAEEPWDPPLPDWPQDASGTDIMVGRRGYVPRPCRVTARFRPGAIDEGLVRGGPFRSEPEMTVTPFFTRPRILRPFGLMTVAYVWRGRLKVVYRAAADARGDQCETGAWFWIGHARFLDMSYTSRLLRAEFAREIAEVRSLLSRL